jgi:hypothetical protein
MQGQGHWTRSAQLPGQLIHGPIDFAIIGSRIIVAQTQGLLVSDDMGHSWRMAAHGRFLGITPPRRDTEVVAAYGYKQLAISRNAGQAWTVVRHPGHQPTTALDQRGELLVADGTRVSVLDSRWRTLPDLSHDNPYAVFSESEGPVVVADHTGLTLWNGVSATQVQVPRLIRNRGVQRAAIPTTGDEIATASNLGDLAISCDRGATWSWLVKMNKSSAAASGYVPSLSFDTRAGLLFAVLGSHLKRFVIHC